MYVSSDGKLHYVNKDGADSALPFNRSGYYMEYLNNGWIDTANNPCYINISLAAYPNFRNISAGNIHVGIISCGRIGTSVPTDGYVIINSYDPVTGMLTLRAHWNLDHVTFGISVVL